MTCTSFYRLLFYFFFLSSSYFGVVLIAKKFSFSCIRFFCSFLYKSIMIMYKVAMNSAIGACLNLHNGSQIIGKLSLVGIKLRRIVWGAA